MSTDAKRRANKAYLSKQDEIRLRIPKGHKEEIRQAAQQAGQSMNQYIIEAVAARMWADAERAY
jgi:predicted HicB family RNase H-like nuclease